MLRKVLFGFVAAVLGVAGLYALNPLGTASLDPRARLMGYAVFSISSESMAPTLSVGDLVWVSTFAPRFKAIERGDLIVFRYPTDPSTAIVGRVVGQSGETITIVDGLVLIDGKALEEPYLGGRRLSQPYSLQMEPVRIPEGHLFILGDYRDNSLDSRFWGPLPIDQVVGKVSMTIDR